MPAKTRSAFPSPKYESPNSIDRELVRKFVRESILGVPERYREPYFLNPKADPFQGEEDPDWVVLRGFDNDMQTLQSSASASQMEREVTATDVAYVSALCGRGHSPVSNTSASPALEQTSHSSASAPQIKREVAEAPQIGREVAESVSAVDARRVDGGSLHSGGSVARTGAQLKSTGVPEAVRKDETRARTPGEGSLSGGGGGAVDARRVDDGSLHSGDSATKAGTQFRGVDVAKAVHRGDAGVRTPGEGSLSGEEGSAVDARRVDDGSLHNGCVVTRVGAQLKSTGVAEAVRKD